MLIYEQSCMECGKIQRRFHLEAWNHERILKEQQVRKCGDCGSTKLKTERINTPKTFKDYL